MPDKEAGIACAVRSLPSGTTIIRVSPCGEMAVTSGCVTCAAPDANSLAPCSRSGPSGASWV